MQYTENSTGQFPHDFPMEKKTSDIDTQWNAVHRKFYRPVSSRLSNETEFL